MRERILAGRLIDKENNFIFQVTAYRKMSRQELQGCYQIWLAQPRRPKILKNKTITVETFFGSTGGFW
jgi:hypothetical protein